MERPLCSKCRVNLARKNYKNGKYMATCDSCSRSPKSRRERMDKKIVEQRLVLYPWRAYKKDYCENPDCTATILHPCQLDVDHKDGDKNNNDPSNFMTLCANCHRLKTLNAGENKERRPKRTYEENDPALDFFNPQRHRVK